MSISQSAMVGDVFLGAAGSGKNRSSGAAAGATGKASKGKGAAKEKASKDSSAADKEREAVLGRGLRAARMAAVRAARKGA